MGQKHSGHYCQDICHELEKHGCDCDQADVGGEKPQRLIFDQNLLWWIAIIVVILLVVLLLSGNDHIIYRGKRGVRIV